VDVTHLRNRHRDHRDEHIFVPVSRCLPEFGGWVAQTGRIPCHVWGESGSRVVHARAGGVEPCFGLFGMGSSDSDSNGAFSPFSLRGRFLIDRSIEGTSARDIETG
jgi:hypothetical protein